MAWIFMRGLHVHRGAWGGRCMGCADGASSRLHAYMCSNMPTGTPVRWLQAVHVVPMLLVT